jgi:hypothetical protein
MRFGGPDQSGGHERVFGARRVFGFAVRATWRAWTAGFAHRGRSRRASLSCRFRHRVTGLVTEQGTGRSAEVLAAGARDIADPARPGA